MLPMPLLLLLPLPLLPRSSTHRTQCRDRGHAPQRMRPQLHQPQLSPHRSPRIPVASHPLLLLLPITPLPPLPQTRPAK